MTKRMNIIIAMEALAKRSSNDFGANTIIMLPPRSLAGRTAETGPEKQSNEQTNDIESINLDAPKQDREFKLLDFCLKLLALELVEQQVPSKVCNRTLKIYQLETCFSSCVFTRRNESRTRKRLQFMLFAYTIYGTIKFMILGFLHQLYDYNWQTLQNPQVRAGSNRTEFCALKKDVNFADEQRSKTLDEQSGWIYYLGDNLLNQRGAPGFLQVVLATYPTIYYFLTMFFIRLQSIRMDILSFIYHPEFERQRIKSELKLIEDELIKFSIKRAHSMKANRCLSILRGHHLRDYYLKVHTSAQSGINNNNNEWCRRTHIEGSEDIRLLLDLKLDQLVEPAVLTTNHRRIQLKLNRLFILAHWSSSMIAGCGVYFYIHLTQFIFNTKQRLKIIHCKRWHPDGIVIAKYLPKLNNLNSKHDLLAYLAYDDKFGFDNNIEFNHWSLYKLAATIEIQLDLNIKKLIYYFDGLCLIILGSFWVSTIFNLFITSLLDKITWLNQIERQMEDCSALMEKHKENSKSVKYLESITNVADENATIVHDCKIRVKLVKSLLEVYSNYELLRRQLPNYKLVAEFFITQAALQTALALMMSYIIGSNIDDSDSKLLLFTITYLVFYVNCYLVGGAYFVNKLDRLLKTATKLIAHATETPAKSSFVLQTWRRQLVSEKDVRGLYSPKILGANLSFGLVMSFNFYLAVIWLVILRTRERTPGKK